MVSFKIWIMKKTLKRGCECPENDNECSCVINDPMLSQYRVDQYITTGKHTMKTLDNQIPKYGQEIYKYHREHKIHEEKAIIMENKE